MKLQTNIPLKPVENQIDYKSQLLLLGSCFSMHMGDKLEYFKFQSFQNPFGILFHPLAIEKLISKATLKESYTDEHVFLLNERWHCFDAHSDLSDVSKENLLEKLNTILEKTNQQLTKSTHVVITLGTAWVYKERITNAVVANCHKVPQASFTKELLSVNQIVKSLENTIENMQAVNPEVHVIFTVSPVRHLKDGFIENQRSKAHLIAAIQDLVYKSKASASYFPSYEIMMDELRDYRFYKADMVHPNQIAIDYIWEKFMEVWIASNAYSTMNKVAIVQKGLQHRPFNAVSQQHLLFLKSLEEKIEYLQQEHLFMQFLIRY